MTPVLVGYHCYTSLLLLARETTMPPRLVSVAGQLLYRVACNQPPAVVALSVEVERIPDFLTHCMDDL